MESRSQNIYRDADVQKIEITCNKDNTVDMDNNVITAPLETIVLVTSKQVRQYLRHMLHFNIIYV